MNFLLIGSMNSYIKNLGMHNKWNQKKKNNDFTPDESLTKKQRLNEQFKASYLQQKELEKELTDEALNTIHTKIQAGTKLTPDEMNYLRTKDPTTYQKLKNLEQEKKQYERELKQCKTKEDVQKLKFSKINASLSAINAVKDNPNIPDSQKLAVAAQEQRRLTELDKIFTKFVKSSEYKNTPTEAELDKVQNDIQKAEEAENQQKTENNNISDNADKKENTEPQTEINNDISDNTPDKVQAEQSPEAQKVKRTKAKAAYQKSAFVENEEPAVILKG